jgi:uncharacterized Zn-binding protein involved in type VI secretion
MRPAAKRDDRIVGLDTHLCSGAPLAVPFEGSLVGDLSPDVLAEHRPMALVGSVAINLVPHVPPAGTTFDVPPSNRGVIVVRGATVFANGRAVARDGDLAETCNDPAPAAVGRVLAEGTVRAGG